ncbi:MAG: hypothetical protein K2H86_08760, partial [Muribaculaceae bacterium]|nr:hypothetical protein [Muribaculaceae bacterium]
LVCNNSFHLYNLANGKTIKVSDLNWENDPKTFTFIGAKPSSSELLFQNASFSEGANIPSINSISFEFNEDIKIAQNKPVQIYKGEELLTSSKSIEVDSENEKSLIVIFDEVNLYLGNEYSIKLPEGVVSLKNDAAVLNKPVEIKVNGTSTIRLPIKSVSPENNSTVLPDKAVIKFNLESGQTLTAPQGIQHERGIDFYKGEISDENFIGTLLGTASGDVISWDLSSYMFEPATKYILHKKADDITVWVNGKSQPAYGNEEVIINFTTPSVEDAGYAPLEFGALQYSTDGNYIDYSEGAKAAKLKSLKIKLKDKYYYHNSTKYELSINDNVKSEGCKIYEVTTSGDKLLSSFNLAISKAEDATSYYNIARSDVNAILYEGKTYKVVIPKGYFTAYPTGTSANLNPMMNYLGSNEMSFIFTGATPTHSVLLSCNVEDNAEKASLYNIVWTFEGEYSPKEENSSVKYSYVREDGIKSQVITVPVTISTYSGNTAVSVDFVSKTSGEPMKLRVGATYTFTLPEGTLVNKLNDEIVNDEIILTIKGGEEKVAKTVNVKLDIDGLHTSTHPATEGKTYQFTLEPAENWKVDYVRNGENKVNPIIGTNTYMLSALKGDTELTAHLEYTGTFASYDEITHVWEIEDKNIRIYGDSDHIVVDGVTPENTICVYNVAGMLINTIHVSDGNDRVIISVPLRQTYIVTVDGVAAKIMM